MAWPRLHPTPRGLIPVHSTPGGQVPLVRPLGVGHASLDTKKRNSTLPNPKGARLPSDGGVGPAGGPCYLRPSQEAKTRAHGQTFDTRWEWAQLDMTWSHGRPHLGGPRHPQCQAWWDGALGSTDDARRWRQQQTRPRREAVSITISIVTWRHLCHYLWEQQDTPTGGGGWHNPRAISSSIFLFPRFFSLSLSYIGSFPWPIKGKVGCPIRGSSFWSPWPIKIMILFW
jgi:hypothetical protein